MKTALRWTARIGGALLALVIIALVAVYGVSEYRMRKSYDVRPAPLTFRVTPDAVAKGRHIAVTRGCTGCHGENLAGSPVIDAPAIGRLSGTNLTRGKGGIGGERTDEDWVRAIRHGVAPDGRALLFMPSHEFNPLGDEDVGALVAYIKSVPPVDNEVPRNRVGPVGRALFLAGQIHLIPAEMIKHDAPRSTPPAPGATKEYGAYLATGCVGCHGDGLAGGKIPGGPPEWPAAANLTPDPETGLGKWTEQDFFRAMREGKRPDGREIREPMPWKSFAQLSDEELRAMWLHLRSIPAKPAGSR